MSGLLWTVLAFIVAIGLLVVVHEFGHYWVARRVGVKVLRFSVGFGKPLWRWRRAGGETEYVVSALPLGGYVKMLDEREGDVAPEEAARAFNRQPPRARIAIAAAGPLFNLLFAVLAYWLMFLVGVDAVRPIVGDVRPESVAAEAGLKSGDTLVRVGEQPVTSWEEAILALTDAAMTQERVAVAVRTQDGGEAVRRLDLSGREDWLQDANLPGRLGVEPWRPPLPPVIGVVEEGSAAARAGLQSGDRLLRLDGRALTDWEAWAAAVRDRPGQAVPVTVERDGTTQTLTVRPEPVTRDGETMGYVGAGARIPEDWLDPVRVRVRYGPLEGLARAAEKTWDVTTLTVRMLASMVTGTVPLDNIGGPITIAQVAGQSASVGLAPFLAFLAVISVSLALLNLLPIPMLDGGHLLYDFIELARGRPLSEQAQQIGQRIGLALLLTLMALAFYNDLARLAG